MKPRELQRIFRANELRNVRSNPQSKGLAMSNNRIASPPNALLRVTLTVDLNTGESKLQCNQMISASRLISLFAATIKANADQMIAIESRVIQNNGGGAIQIAPHDFNGDDAGVCTVCGKLENAHQTVQ